MEPERRLVVAVLQDAIAIYLKCDDAGDCRERALFAEVCEWFAADDDGGWPFSFVNVCGVLDLSPTHIRSLLAAARHQRRVS